MTLDINKIIQESVQDTIDQSKPEVETLEKNDTSTSQDTEVVEEGTSVSTSVQESYDPAMASAISAGLGAMNFRNHVKAIQEEGKLKKAGKAAAGVGAGAAGTLGGLAALGKGDLSDGVERAGEAISGAVGKAKDALNGGDSGGNKVEKLKSDGKSAFKGPGERGEPKTQKPSLFKGPGERGSTSSKITSV